MCVALQDAEVLLSWDTETEWENSVDGELTFVLAVPPPVPRRIKHLFASSYQLCSKGQCPFVSSLGIQAIDWWAKRPWGEAALGEGLDRRISLETIFLVTLPSRAARARRGGSVPGDGGLFGLVWCGGMRDRALKRARVSRGGPRQPRLRRQTRDPRPAVRQPNRDPQYLFGLGSI